MLNDVDIRMIGISCSMTPYEEAMLRRIVTNSHSKNDYAYNDALIFAADIINKDKQSGPLTAISVYIGLASRAFANGRGAMSMGKRIALRCLNCRNQWYVFAVTRREYEVCTMCKNISNNVNE